MPALPTSNCDSLNKVTQGNSSLLSEKEMTPVPVKFKLEEKNIGDLRKILS